MENIYIFLFVSESHVQTQTNNMSVHLSALPVVALSSQPTGSYWGQKSLKTGPKYRVSFLNSNPFPPTAMWRGEDQTKWPHSPKFLNPTHTLLFPHPELQFAEAWFSVQEVVHLVQRCVQVLGLQSHAGDHPALTRVHLQPSVPEDTSGEENTDYVCIHKIVNFCPRSKKVDIPAKVFAWLTKMNIPVYMQLCVLWLKCSNVLFIMSSKEKWNSWSCLSFCSFASK